MSIAPAEQKTSDGRNVCVRIVNGKGMRTGHNECKWCSNEYSKEPTKLNNNYKNSHKNKNQDANHTHTHTKKE